MAAYCVFDIGGTNFRCGIYSQGVINDIQKYPTPNFLNIGNVDSIQTRLTNMICDCYISLIQKCSNKIIGISFPGPVNDIGEVHASSVIFGEALHSTYKLKEEVRKQLMTKGFNTDVFVTNDVSASAWRYADNKMEPFCIITVSSGIGNKIYANGNLLLDKNGLSGEMGHYSTYLEDVCIPCSCGWGNNHIGMIASGRGIETIAKLFAQEKSKYHALFVNSKLAAECCQNNSYNINNIAIARCADNGDLFSMEIIDYCTRPLAECMCLLASAMYLKHFIIIGGFALNCNYYIKSLKNNMMKIGIYNYLNEDINKMVVLGENDDEHALIGLGKKLEHDYSLDYEA